MPILLTGLTPPEQYKCNYLVDAPRAIDGADSGKTHVPAPTFADLLRDYDGDKRLGFRGLRVVAFSADNAARMEMAHRLKAFGGTYHPGSRRVKFRGGSWVALAVEGQPQDALGMRVDVVVGGGDVARTLLDFAPDALQLLVRPEEQAAFWAAPQPYSFGGPTIDGVTPQVGDRYLLSGQANPADNGPHTVTLTAKHPAPRDDWQERLRQTRRKVTGHPYRDPTGPILRVGDREYACSAEPTMTGWQVVFAVDHRGIVLLQDALRACREVTLTVAGAEQRARVTETRITKNHAWTMAVVTLTRAWQLLAGDALDSEALRLGLQRREACDGDESGGWCGRETDEALRARLMYYTRWPKREPDASTPAGIIEKVRGDGYGCEVLRGSPGMVGVKVLGARNTDLDYVARLSQWLRATSPSDVCHVVSLHDCSTCGCKGTCEWRERGEVDPDAVTCEACQCRWCGCRRCDDAEPFGRDRCTLPKGHTCEPHRDEIGNEWGAAPYARPAADVKRCDCGASAVEAPVGLWVVHRPECSTTVAALRAMVTEGKQGAVEVRDVAAVARRAKEAPLVALVNAVPEGLDANGWRAAVLAAVERNEVVSWRERFVREVSALCRSGEHCKPGTLTAVVHAVVAYRHAIDKHKPPAPERRKYDPYPLVCDAYED